MLCRVYARSNPNSIIKELEGAASQAALITIALSRSDAAYIAQHYLPEKTQACSKPHVSLYHFMLRLACLMSCEGSKCGTDDVDSHWFSRRLCRSFCQPSGRTWRVYLCLLQQKLKQGHFAWKYFQTAPLSTLLERVPCCMGHSVWC